MRRCEFGEVLGDLLIRVIKSELAKSYVHDRSKGCLISGSALDRKMSWYKK